MDGWMDGWKAFETPIDAVHKAGSLYHTLFLGITDRENGAY